MKKLVALLLAVIMMMGLVNIAVAEDAPAYKIAIMTGTNSQGEEEVYAASALAAGVHRAAPGAEVISWTYGHRFWPLEDVRDYVRRAPGDAILMQNFEEMGYASQLGRKRQGVDYWLSYAGPSPLFETTAEEALSAGKRSSPQQRSDR